MSEPISDPSPERAARDLYEGTAHGGPLDGQELASRFPKGVVAISNESSLAWIYDRHDDGGFYVREDDGRPLDDNAHEEAAEGGDYEVLAVA